MTIRLKRAFLFLSVVKQSIVAGVKCILGTYCKGAVHKKGDKVLAGACAHVYLIGMVHIIDRRGVGSENLRMLKCDGNCGFVNGSMHAAWCMPALTFSPTYTEKAWCVCNSNCSTF